MLASDTLLPIRSRPVNDRSVTTAVIARWSNSAARMPRTVGVMDWRFQQELRRLASMGETDGRIRCVKRESPDHMTLKLTVEEMNVEVSARRDLDPEVVLAVVRSLHRVG